MIIQAGVNAGQVLFVETAGFSNMLGSLNSWMHFDCWNWRA
jgi:hypothetical protein